MDDNKDLHGESPNIEVVNHHKDSFSSWDELKYLIRKYYLLLLVLALIPVALLSLGQQLANRGSAAPRLNLGPGGQVGVQGGGTLTQYECPKQDEEKINCNVYDQCMICSKISKSSYRYFTCDQGALDFCDAKDSCSQGEFQFQCLVPNTCFSCQYYNYIYGTNSKSILHFLPCTSDELKAQQVQCGDISPTLIPGTTKEPPAPTQNLAQVCNNNNTNNPTSEWCRGVPYNGTAKTVNGIDYSFLTCVPNYDKDHNCSGVNSAPPPTNPPAQPTSAQQPTTVPGSTTCNPGEWGACGTHGCGGRQLPNCDQSGTKWNCSDAFAQC